MHLWQVYHIHLSSDNQNMPFMHFHVPWSKEDLYNLVTLRTPSSPSSVLTKVLYRQIRLKLHRPYQSTNQYPSLELFLDPNSSYTLQITYSFLDVLSQLVRYYIYYYQHFYLLFYVYHIQFKFMIPFFVHIKQC